MSGNSHLIDSPPLAAAVPQIDARTCVALVDAATLAAGWGVSRDWNTPTSWAR
jgi:hypothetical protein